MKLITAIFLTTGLALAGAINSAAGPETPSVVYSTYLGSYADEQGRSVAMDSAGRAYVTGYTSSAVFPAPRPGASPDHGVDVYAVRFDPGGSSADYLYWFNALTLYAEDEGYSIAADAQGNAYVTGYTRSEDFCTVFGAVPGYHTTYYGETDAFVLKIKADGSGLAYCTFLGGSDWDAGRAITVDQLGNAYVVGGTWSRDFPTTAGAAQGNIGGLRDVFLAKLSSDGTALMYSTFLGGAGQEDSTALAITSDNGVTENIVYATGWTNSGDFPVTGGVLGPTYSGNTDGFLFKLDLGAGSLAYATYLGGSDDDRPTSLTVADAGGALVTGYTQSPDFPTTPGAWSEQPLGGVDGFAAQVNVTGDILKWGTYIGGSGNDQIWDAAYDSAVDIVGETMSSDFPVTAGAFSASLNGPSDAFVFRLAPDGRGILYGSYFGGSSTDRAYGVVTGGPTIDTVVTGITLSSDFPTTPLAYDTEYNGSGDVFVTKLNLGVVDVLPRPRAWLPLVRRS
ncbi:MAG: SBBP repeat-containing protein [Caldilineales bacterium]